MYINFKFNINWVFFMVVIEKKILPKYFELIKEGKKNFEVRLGDFEIKEGDILLIKEWDSNKKVYTGRELRLKVSYVTNTKWQNHWSKEKIEKYGLWVIGFKKE